MKKYELLKDDYIDLENTRLYRIRAVKDFNDVKTGDLGGYIESEENLSHIGTAWVYGRARVFGDAEVFGNAWVFGNADVDSDKSYIVFRNNWSRADRESL